MALLALAVSGASAATDRFVLLDQELRASVVTVRSIGPGGLRVVDEGGAERDVPLATIAAIAPGWWRPGTEGSELAWSAPAPGPKPGALPGMLRLTDGRRLAGHIAFADVAEDAVVWDSPQLARSVFRLDDIRVLENQGVSAEAGVRGAGDHVVMVNGDVLSGFVARVATSVKLESDGRKLDLPISQVARLELANPARAPRGLRLWLQDGTVCGASGFGAPKSPSELRLLREPAPGSTPGDGDVAISLEDIMALAPDAATVIPLASLAIAEQRALGERRFAEPVVLRWRGETLGAAWRDSIEPGTAGAPLDAPDIDLPGPMVAEWRLPEGARRAAGWAEVPQGSRLWADCTLVLEAVGRGGVVTELARQGMGGSRPVFEFAVDFPASTELLRVSVEEGARGPIQDRVVLRRALVLVAPSGGGSPAR